MNRSRVTHSIGLRTTQTLTASPLLEIIAGGKDLCLYEIELNLVAATASELGLGRPAAIGVGPTSPVQAVPLNGGRTIVTGKMAVAWTTTAPTSPTTFFKRSALPGNIGASVVWNFEESVDDGKGGDGLIIPAGTSVVLWSLSAVSVLNVNITIEE